MKTPLVSVITPCHNAARFIGAAIDSVRAQTMPDWEMLIVDDASTDASAAIAAAYAARDERIRLLSTVGETTVGDSTVTAAKKSAAAPAQKTAGVTVGGKTAGVTVEGNTAGVTVEWAGVTVRGNTDSTVTDPTVTDSTVTAPAKKTAGVAVGGAGAAHARNLAIAAARGRFIAFLDADDLWFADKLARQIAFMNKHGQAFSYASYRLIDAAGRDLGAFKVPAQITRADLLKVNSVSCLAAIYDARALGKMFMPGLPGGHDYALWLAVVKRVGSARGIARPLAAYRIGQRASLSGNKLRAARQRWRIYRRIERLGVVAAAYYFCHYAAHGLVKYFWHARAAGWFAGLRRMRGGGGGANTRPPAGSMDSAPAPATGAMDSRPSPSPGAPPSPATVAPESRPPPSPPSPAHENSRADFAVARAGARRRPPAVLRALPRDEQTPSADAVGAVRDARRDDGGAAG